MAGRTGWYSVTHTSGGSGDEIVLTRDVSGYPTYELLAGRINSAVRELATLRLRWYDVNPAVVSGATPGLDVSWEFFSVDSLPLTGPHHGRYLEVVLRNPGAGREVAVSVADTTAPEQRHRTMQVTGLLLNATWASVAAGGSGSSAYGLAASGPVTVVLGAPAQKGEFRVNAGSTPLGDYVIDPATGPKERTLTLEAHRAPIWVSVINRGTLAGGFSARAVTGNA